MNKWQKQEASAKSPWVEAPVQHGRARERERERVGLWYSLAAIWALIIEEQSSAKEASGFQLRGSFWLENLFPLQVWPNFNHGDILITIIRSKKGIERLSRSDGEEEGEEGCLWRKMKDEKETRKLNEIMRINYYTVMWKNYQAP